MDNFDHDDVLDVELNLGLHCANEIAEVIQSLNIRGVPGRQLLQFAGTIDSDDLKLMSQVIEEGCGQVDFSGW